ncbi:hypothetical protein FRC03_002484 [Tulasnella sp. 419]|nr:hypothetical protein FRC03_002484 [Tulasnella sp. 419]
MAARIPPWPPKITEEQHKELVKLSTTFALTRGLSYLPVHPPEGPPPAPTSSIHAPFTLFPAPFPRHLFEQSLKIQRIYNVLYSRIALDEEFIDSIMKEVEPADPFTGTLWKGWRSLRKEEGGLVQRLHLGLFRSDYMIHQSSKELSLKQVEFNTISSSFGPLSQRVAELHRYLFHATNYYDSSPHFNRINFPPNETLSGLVRGLVEGHRAYGVERAVILFVVQEGERNVFDQRLLEYELVDKYGITVIRHTLGELSEYVSVDSNKQILTVTSPTRASFLEVSVVYYRAGYTPDDYPTPEYYETRFNIERSRAIKCPTIALQLAGGKKIQQVLTNPGVLESFLLDPRWGDAELFTAADLSELRATWVDMWALNEAATPETLDGVSRARADAENLVIKPQREGGGNNIYKSNIPGFLDNLPASDTVAWIAMQLISAPRGVKNQVAKAGSAHSEEKEIVNELGIFGWALFEKDKGEAISRISEEQCGWLVRTKGKDSDEGGVAVGYSVLDSLLLI